jgi:SH3-like domain-containing protein
MTVRGLVLALVLAGAAAMLLALTAMPLQAQTDKPEKSAKLPRFASLRSAEVNLRTGPGPRFPVDWVLVRRDMPVEIVAEFETWRKIRDSDHTEGWVQQSMLSPRRHALVAGTQTRSLRQAPADDAPTVARIEPGVIGQLLQCEQAWCRIQAAKVTGWIRRAEVWGTYPDEDLK